MRDCGNPTPAGSFDAMTNPKILLATWNLETGEKREYRFDYEWKFHQWQAFREHQPFTEKDLIAVIRTIKAGIKTGKRNPGALRFSRLIEDPSNFEEEISLAKFRPIAPPTERQRVLFMTGREEKPAATPANSAGDVLAGLKKWKEQADKLAQWRKENLENKNPTAPRSQEPANDEERIK